jgi:fluoride exporter
MRFAAFQPLVWSFQKAMQRRNMTTFIIISVGAVLGANARYWVAGWAANRFGTDFPYGTFLINLLGSFLMGLFFTLATERFLIDPNIRLLVTVGFLGSYTTFSTYEFESVSLILSGQWFLGLVDLLGSAIMGAVAMIIGMILGRLV